MEEATTLSQFFINEYNKVKAENEKQKNTIQELQGKLNECERKGAKGFVTLGQLYQKENLEIDCCFARNYKKFKEAVKNRDYKAFLSQACENGVDANIRVYNWNYEIKLNFDTILLDIVFYRDNDIYIQNADLKSKVNKECYNSIEEAKQGLLNQAEELIKKYEKEEEEAK